MPLCSGEFQEEIRWGAVTVAARVVAGDGGGNDFIKLKPDIHYTLHCFCLRVGHHSCQL